MLWDIISSFETLQLGSTAANGVLEGWGIDNDCSTLCKGLGKAHCPEQKVQLVSLDLKDNPGLERPILLRNAGLGHGW